jgi:GrpB-like predicted nucleotidyltransferase (UPF0157 family)
LRSDVEALAGSQQTRPLSLTEWRASAKRTKLELAQKKWKYVQNYADAKSAVVRQILTRASL